MVNEPYAIFYQSAMALSLLVSLGVILLMWRRRRFPGALAMIVLAAATFIWTLGFLLEAYSDTLERQLFFCSVGYLGSMSVPVAWFVFSLQYVSGSRAITWRRLALLCVVPLTTMALVWTNEWHQLMWTDERLTTSGPFLITSKTYAPMFWIAMMYTYTLVLSGVFVLVRRLFVGPPLYAVQAVSLVVAVSLPLAWNFIYIFDLVPLPHKDLTPVAFAISGMAIALGVIRFRLFEAVPIARELILDQMKDGVVVFDNNNRLLELNPAAARILSVDYNAVGTELHDLARELPVMERLAEKCQGRKELALTLAGEKRFYEIETMSMHDRQGVQVGWLAMLHDITERIRAEKRLNELYEIEQRERRELEEIAQERGLFIEVLAHELWTPLTPVIASMTLLNETISGSKAGTIEHRLVSNAMSGIDGLASSVRDLLDLGRISKGTFKLNKQPLHPKEVVDSAVLKFQDQADKREQQLIVDMPDELPDIEADPLRVHQVLMNLLANASKFSNASEPIKLRVSVWERSLVFDVEDRGIGMTREEQQRLFKPYHTVRQDQHRFSGLGLGLAISKEIVESHGGSMWFSSERGKGSTFSFSLPLQSRT